MLYVTRPGSAPCLIREYEWIVLITERVILQIKTSTRSFNNACFALSYSSSAITDCLLSRHNAEIISGRQIELTPTQSIRSKSFPPCRFRLHNISLCKCRGVKKDFHLLDCFLSLSISLLNEAPLTDNFKPGCFHETTPSSMEAGMTSATGFP